MVPVLVALIALLFMAAPARAEVPFTEELVKLAEQRYPTGCKRVRVTQTFTVGAYGRAMLYGCDIWLPTDQHLRHWSMRDLCRVIVHEVGHLAGLDHSDDPYDPMWPYYSSSRAEIPECENLPIQRWRAKRTERARVVKRSKARALRRYRACRGTRARCVRIASRSCGKHRRRDCWRFIAARV